jgi:hypothetical protein
MTVFYVINNTVKDILRKPSTVGILFVSSLKNMLFQNVIKVQSTTHHGDIR